MKLVKKGGEKVKAGKPSVSLCWITKAKAAEWLSSVNEKRQRPYSPIIGKRYARIMDNLQWAPKPTEVVFDVHGDLINGQHALQAFGLSKLTKLWVALYRNMPPEAWTGYDKCRKRNVADDLRTDGLSHAAEVGSVGATIWKYENDVFVGTKYMSARTTYPTNEEVREVVRLHPGIGDYLYKNPFRGKGLSIGGLRAASYILHQLDENKAKQFIRSFIEGVDYTPTHDHPIWVLRNRFQKMGDNERLRDGETMALIFKAWNLCYRGEKVGAGQQLLRKGEPFPKPLPHANLAVAQVKVVKNAG